MSATGFVHGGTISTLADTAIGFGCYISLPPVIFIFTF